LEYNSLLKGLCPPEGIKYLKRYFTLLEGAKEVSKGQYGEWHHFLPASLFPQFKNRKAHPWNQKRISAKTHFVAHYLLYRALRNQKMTCAWLYMFAQARHIDERHLNIYAEKYATAKARLNHDTSSGKTVVVDDKGVVSRVDVNDKRILSGELKSINAGKVVVIDPKTGECLRIDKSDSRYVSGLLRGIRTGLVRCVNPKTGETIGDFPTDYPKILSGEYRTMPNHLYKTGKNTQGKRNFLKHNSECRGKKWFNNGVKSKQFFSGDEALDRGYPHSGLLPNAHRGRPKIIK
jgi:hypothetical protein